MEDAQRRGRRSEIMRHHSRRLVFVAVALLAALFAVAVACTIGGDDSRPRQSVQVSDPTEFIPTERGQPVGTPVTLPLSTTDLTTDELAVARDVVRSVPEVASIQDKRTQLVHAELDHEKGAPCDDASKRACAYIAVFNYDDAYCLQIVIDLFAHKPLRVQKGWCDISQEERAQARSVAEADPRVQDLIKSGGGVYIGGRRFIPKNRLEGHRYVGLRYTLDSGTAAVEFVVDLNTAQVVCYDC